MSILMNSNFNRRLNVKPVIAVPRGSILPTDLDVPAIMEGTFLEKMYENMQHKVALVVLTTEELIVLVEKPHLFGLDVIALVGVPGGRYDAVWSSYIAPLKRVSLDTLKGELRKILEAAPAPESEPAHLPEDPEAAAGQETFE